MKTATQFFEEISKIPRSSGNEQQIADYLENFALSHGFFCYRDKENNVLIRKDGSVDSIILQGHTDMVCVKELFSTHNFDTDPIPLVYSGKYLTADKTTLGADNGVAVAAMLAILDDPEIPGTVECLFTSMEEIGLCGIKRFDCSLLKGRTLINLDSMSEGVATVTCSGSVRSDITIPAKQESGVYNGYTLTISELYGGHSGDDINRGRHNANQTIFSFLRKLEDVRIHSISGGFKDNAIARECTVTFSTKTENAKEILTEENNKLRQMVIEDDKNYHMSIEESSFKTCFSAELTEKIQHFLDSVPLGVIEMSPLFPSLVQTSSNFSIIRTLDDGLKMTISSRSAEEKRLDAVLDNIVATTEEIGASIFQRERYSAWAFEEHSAIRDLYIKTYESLYAKTPECVGTHTGVECGVIKACIPDMDLLSIGANIQSPHTPDETLDVESLERLTQTLKKIIIYRAL